MTGEWKPGGAPGDVDRAWSATRDRGRNGRTVAIAAALVAAVLVVAVIIAVTAGGGDGKTPPQAGPTTAAPETAVPPGDGDYRITVAHTGFCLGAQEQPGHDRFAMMQVDCPEAVPKLTLEKHGETYRVLMHYPDLQWIACMSLDGEEPGYLYGPQQCEKDMVHDFTLTPAPEGTFLIKSPGGMCMDAYEGGTTPGTLFSAEHCKPDAASQRYRFEKL
ncbi:hypothetical protein Afil01_13060 [Actinorhabdospora filicis]|uniref:Ricin B lectin domain-containing protein n=1 Tax=Actinorhabdospora filicis TaxID=1785913 RepID=A0A9W6SG25_9ACTN|nr:hypothetical protein [Actinorhabdospora filicis]GLZ76499.1 hypothetical protein Afil01_13060 [Actinorhabdospora filicis]